MCNKARRRFRLRCPHEQRSPTLACMSSAGRSLRSHCPVYYRDPTPPTGPGFSISSTAVWHPQPQLPGKCLFRLAGPTDRGGMLLRHDDISPRLAIRGPLHVMLPLVMSIPGCAEWSLGSTHPLIIVLIIGVPTLTMGGCLLLFTLGELMSGALDERRRDIRGLVAAGTVVLGVCAKLALAHWAF